LTTVSKGEVMQKAVERKDTILTEDKSLERIISAAKVCSEQGILRELARSSTRAGILEALVLNPHTQDSEHETVARRLISDKKADATVVRKILLKIYISDNASEETKNLVNKHLSLNDADGKKAGSFWARFIRTPQHA
jgi:hypothetical protein